MRIRPWVALSGVVRFKVAAVPSAQVMPFDPPLYALLIVPPVGSVTEARRPVTLGGEWPGVPSYAKEYELPSGSEIPAQQHLQTAMIPFAHVSLQQFAIQVFAVGTVAGRQIFAERYNRCCRHGALFPYSILSQRLIGSGAAHRRLPGGPSPETGCLKLVSVPTWTGLGVGREQRRLKRGRGMGGSMLAGLGF